MAKNNEGDEGLEEVKLVYKTIKFGRVGDTFVGTLTNNTKKMANQLSEKKEMQTIFEFKAKRGSLHLITDREADKNATDIVAGDEWSFITGKAPMLKMLEGAKIGQIVQLQFTEERPAKVKGFNKTKIVKVSLGKMDNEYLASLEGEDLNVEM